MNVGSSEWGCKWSFDEGEEHRKPGGSSFTCCKSFIKIEARDASVSCRSERFGIRTKEWKAAKSNNTSAFHISAFNFIGTSDITLVSSCIDLVWSSTDPC